MRHGKTFNHLGRTASHRNAMLANMASSLIVHKRITTTLAKAKALRKFVEPIITKGKEDSTNSRRVVFGYLQNKDSVKELFGTVAPKIGERPGGYTRILKLTNRKGDNAEMAIMELVDFNDVVMNDKAVKTEAKKTTRRSRAKAPKATDAPAAEETTTETAE
jgi:large subunit ribosomal protein L17